MSKNRIIAPLLGLLLLSSGAALAEPSYKSKDVVKHFNLGPSRGLCIGTEGECNGAATAKPAQPIDSFDLVITFDYNSDALTEQARQNLEEFQKALQDPGLATSTFVVEGHTDARGADSYNLTLSERRANAVVRYLSEKGVSPERLEPHGYGKTKPRTSDPFDAANRRVEARLRTQ